MKEEDHKENFHLEEAKPVHDLKHYNLKNNPDFTALIIFVNDELPKGTATRYYYLKSPENVPYYIKASNMHGMYI